MNHFLPFLSVLLVPFLYGQSISKTKTFPTDAGVINVTEAPWNLDNTGSTDVTTNLQSLIDSAISSGNLVYFPNGTYLVSDTVIGETGGLILIGESRNGVVIRLEDSSPGFDSLKPVINFLGSGRTNNAFYNHIENITIDVGSGNPQAIALLYHANNTGAVRNVKLISSDPIGSGGIGLDDYQTGTVGPYLIKGLEIVGFDIGIRIGTSGRHMVTIQDLHLEGQKETGIEMRYHTLNILNGSFQMDVPAIKETLSGSMINLVQCDFSSNSDEPVSEAAIQVEDSYVYLRDVQVSDFSSTVSVEGTTVLSGSVSDEWMNGVVYRLDENPDEASLQLDFKVSEGLAFPSDTEDWYVVPQNGDDDTESVGEAFASGKSKIMFKPGDYFISQTLTIPPHVSHLYGNYTRLRMKSPLSASDDPLFALSYSEHPLVQIEAFRSNFATSSNPNPFIFNNGTGELLLRDIFWVAGSGFRSEPAAGTVYVENFHTLAGSQDNHITVTNWEIRNQSVHALSWNPEGMMPHADLDGGEFWVFGFKTGEMRGPIVEMSDHAFAELWGGSMNTTKDELDIEMEETLMFEIIDSNLSANLFENSSFSGGGVGWGRHETILEETRFGETKTLLNSDPEVLHRSAVPSMFGATIPLLLSTYDLNSANLLPDIELSGIEMSINGYEFSFTASAIDEDSFPAAQPLVQWRKLSGPGQVNFDSVSGESNTLSFEKEGIYEIGVSASDGAKSTEQTVEVKVMPRQYVFISSLFDGYRYYDSSPQDGIVNVRNFALMQVGDDAANGIASLKFNIPLNPISNSVERLKTAKFWLRITSLNNLSSIVASVQADIEYGVFSDSDFQANRTILDTVSLEGLKSGDWVTIDLTDSVRNHLNAGKSYISLWLEGDGVSPNSSSEQVIFTTTTASDLTTRPRFEARLSGGTLTENSISIDDYQWNNPIFGDFYTISDWIYFSDFGWASIGIDAVDGLSFYSPANDRWYYTTEFSYPWVYDYTQEDWIEF